MSIIDLNLPSLNEPSKTIYDALHNQLTKINVSSIIVQLFKDYLIFIHEIIVTNISLENFLEKHKQIEISDVINNLNMVNTIIQLVSKKLSKYQKLSSTSVPKNI